MADAAAWRREAMELVAAYERADGDAYERHVARVARQWFALLRTPHQRQGAVNAIALELREPSPAGYGCGWDSLRQRFFRWALETEWVKPEHLPPGIPVPADREPRPR